jgi:hypothetical protein
VEGALRLQFRCGLFDIVYIKLDPGLRDAKIARPLIGAEAGLSRLRQWPQGKMCFIGGNNARGDN